MSNDTFHFIIMKVCTYRTSAISTHGYYSTLVVKGEGKIQGRTLFWPLNKKVQKLRIYESMISLQNSILSFTLYSRDLKTVIKVEI